MTRRLLLEFGRASPVSLPHGISAMAGLAASAAVPKSSAVFTDPSWDFHTLDFDHDIAFADSKMDAIIDSTNPDLSDFEVLGGKLIMYHGWADPLVNPRNSIDYLRSVAASGHGKGEDDDDGFARRTRSFNRLFMAPGMTHCAGGPGLNTFDTLTALERWVEVGRAPDKLIASHTTSPTTSCRPRRRRATSHGRSARGHRSRTSLRGGARPTPAASSARRSDHHRDDD